MAAAPLTVTRLLQNPLGGEAPEGDAGDLVRVTDGTRTVYLAPAEYDRTCEADLRYLLASTGTAVRQPNPQGSDHR